MSTPVDRTDEFLLVRTVREHASGITKGMSASTQEQYARKYARMLATGTLPEDAGTKRSYYVQRAALLFGVSVEAQQALKARDKSQHGSEPWLQAMATLKRCEAVYKRYPPDPKKLHHENGSSSFTWADVKRERGIEEKATLLHSKKSLLSKLRRIEDWRGKLFACMASKHRDAVAVIALTGARPSEVARGVTVALENTPQGERLLITIHGTKITSTTGQPMRALRVRIDSVEAKHLVERLRAQGGASLTVATHPVNLCAAVIYAGKKAFPKLKGTVSPYVLRHAVASDLKHERIGAVPLAEVLGHQATGTQTHYGYAICSTGKSAVEAVRASEPVRVTHRRPRAGVEEARSVELPAYRPR